MDTNTMTQQAVSFDLYYEITQFLYREARMLDEECIREWLTDLVDPQICYQMVVTEERFRRDKSAVGAREVMAYDDNINVLELRVRQLETGLQSMMDPPQRMSRIVTNIEAFEGERENEYLVFSKVLASRFRRQYEKEQQVVSRKDCLRRGDDGKLRLVSRRIDIGERVVRNKNLLFFL